jgi:hypothetical protein
VNKVDYLGSSSLVYVEDLRALRPPSNEMLEEG